MLGALFGLGGTPLVRLDAHEESFCVDGRDVKAQVQADGSLRLAVSHMSNNRDECFKQAAASLRKEIRCRRADLKAMAHQIEETVSNDKDDQSVDEVEVDQLGLELAQWCAIKGQHQRRIAAIESQSSIRVRYQQTLKTQELTLKPGVPTRVPWCSKPLVWLLPEESAQGEHVQVTELSEDLPFTFGADALFVICGRNEATLRYTPSEENWDVLSPPPQRRSCYTAVVVDGLIYVNGSAYQQGQTANVFDPLSGQWSPLPLPSKPRYGAATAELDGFLYWVPGESDKYSMERFDPRTKQLSEMPRLQNPRDRLSLTALNGLLYAVGGIDHPTSVERFDPKTGAWSAVKGLTEGRYHHAAVELNGRLYVMGGWGLSNLASAECFDPKTGEWSWLTPMTKCRYGHSAAAVEGRIYVVGGITSYNGVSDEVECYDPHTNTWEVLKTRIPAGAVAWHACVAC